ncbi:MAG: hypothetical protein QM820_51405 [Minicystis sp.]
MRKLIFTTSGLAGIFLAFSAAAQEPPAPAPPPATDAPAQAAPTPAQAPAQTPPGATPSATPPPSQPSTFTKVAGETLDAIGAFLGPATPPPVGNAVQAPVFPEDRTPPGDPQNPKALRFAMHGYFRAPLRIACRGRDNPAPEEASKSCRTPWLVDDDYFRSGFLYTRMPESDWTELWFMAGNQYLTGTVALEGTLFSDWAKPIIDKQLGISRGWLTFRYNFDLPNDIKLRLKVKGGAFSDRFGWQEKYDTYLFGRTHQMGEQVRADLDVGKFTFSALQGFGARLEAIESNQGLTLLNYVRVAASYDRMAELSLYYLRAWTQDKRQLKEIDDGSMRVMGFEARVDSGAFGKLAVDFSQVAADKSTWLSPAIEIMHSAGGRGLTENYFGTEKSDSGTGSLLNLGFQYDFSSKAFFKKILGSNPMGEGDINLSLFGMYTKVGVPSEQGVMDPTQIHDGRQMFKWGTELGVWPLSFLGASFRYDRVIFDIHDDPSAFRIFSPRITLRTNWIGEAMIYAQYSRYMYGERVALRQGQIPLETKPDTDVFKLQAQISF